MSGHLLYKQGLPLWVSTSYLGVETHFSLEGEGQSSEQMAPKSPKGNILEDLVKPQDHPGCLSVGSRTAMLRSSFRDGRSSQGVGNGSQTSLNTTNRNGTNRCEGSQKIICIYNIYSNYIYIHIIYIYQYHICYLDMLSCWIKVSRNTHGSQVFHWTIRKKM